MSPRFATALLTVLLALTLAAAPARAQATDTPPASAEAIKTQIAELERQLTELQIRLAQHAQDETPAAADPTALLKPAGAKPGSATAQPRGPRRVGSVMDLLKRLPKDAQAGDDGLWHPAIAPSAIDHLTYGVWGTPYIADLEVQDVRTENNPALVSDPLASPYKISITFKPIDHDFRGQTVRESFEPVVIYADARQRQRITRLKPGRKADVRAVLKTIKCSSTGNRSLRPNPFGHIPLKNHFSTLAIPGVIAAD